MSLNVKRVILKINIAVSDVFIALVAMEMIVNDNNLSKNCLKLIGFYDFNRQSMQTLVNEILHCIIHKPMAGHAALRCKER